MDVKETIRGEKKCGTKRLSLVYNSSNEPIFNNEPIGSLLINIETAQFVRLLRTSSGRLSVFDIRFQLCRNNRFFRRTFGSNI